MRMDAGLKETKVATPQDIEFLWLELTNRCNLKCVHCYSESGPDGHRADQLLGSDYERLLDEAEELYQRALAVYEAAVGSETERAGGIYYNLACVAALGGERDRAIDLLREAVDRGYGGPQIAEDSDLASLHGDPDFEAIVAEIKRRPAESGL